MNCEKCGYELLDGEKRLHEECGCDFCGTTKRHELWVPECQVAVCHNENEKRIADAVAAERERCAKIADAYLKYDYNMADMIAKEIRESNEGG